MPAPGAQGCGFHTSAQIFQQWPDLKYLPRPEPHPIDVDDYQHWSNEYKDWKNRRCRGDCGYFCRRHGMWVTCGEVRSGRASDRDNQHQSSCPQSHDDFQDLKNSFFRKQEQEQMALAQNLELFPAPDDPYMPPRPGNDQDLAPTMGRLSMDYPENTQGDDNDESIYPAAPQMSPFTDPGWDNTPKLGSIGGYGKSADVEDYRPDTLKDKTSQDHSYEQDSKRQHKSSKSHSKSHELSKKGHSTTSQQKHSRTDKASSKPSAPSKSKKPARRSRPEGESSRPSNYPSGRPEDEWGGLMEEGNEEDYVPPIPPYGGNQDMSGHGGYDEAGNTSWPPYEEPNPYDDSAPYDLRPPQWPSGGDESTSPRRRR